MAARLGLALWLGAALGSGCNEAQPGEPATGDATVAGAAAPAAAGEPAASAPIDEGRLRALLDELPPRRAIGSAGHRAARAFLLGRLGALGLEPQSVSVEWAGAPDADLANLVVVLPAAIPDAPLLLLGTHYDTVAGTPGADDNGTGTVALLELARRLSHPSLAAGRRAEIRFLWFDAEEPGLIGSVAYVRAMARADARRTLGLIQLEMLGFTDRRPGSQRMPPGTSGLFDPGDRGDFLLVVGNVASSVLALAVGDALQAEQGPSFRSEVFALVPGVGWLLPDSRRSDHAPFWDAGLPAVLVTDTADLRSPHYHRASDTPETLDYAFLAAGVRGIERAVLRLAH